jgi:uncharacterized repeat protein (TIGR01451 family)
MSKTASAGPYSIGQPLTYTLVVTNNSPLTATVVTLTDLLPVEVDYVSVTPTESCSETNRVVTCDFGDLAAAGNTNAIIVVTPNTGGVIANIAEVTATTYDPDSDNNTDSATIVVDPIADLSLNNTGEPAQVYAGEPLTYTLTVNNNGPSAASGVILTDTLPGNVNFISVNSTQGTCADPVLGDVVCNLGTIGLGSNAIVTIVVSPNSSVDLYNQAEVASTTYDPVPTNNSDTLDTVVLGSADLVLTMIGEPESVFGGEPLTYTLTVMNNGPSTALGVVLTDTLPENVTFVSGNSTQGTCADPVSGDVVCDLGDIISDNAVTVAILVTVNVNGEYTNNALVTTATHDPNTVNNTDSYITSADDITDIEIIKIGETSFVYAGESLKYTLTVTNNGPSAASGVILTDTLPENGAFSSVSTTQGTCADPVLGDVVCDLGTIPTDSTVAVTLWVTANQGGTLNNTAVAYHDMDDPYLDNNFASEVTIVIPMADLSVIKGEDQDPAYYSHPFTYTVTITNNGPDTATNISITDELPESVLLGSVTLIGGSCSGTSLITCTLGELLSGESVTLTIIVTPTVDGIIQNFASVTSNVVDIYPVNNSDYESTIILPVADLAVTKYGDPGFLYAGENLAYTVYATNNGPSTAIGVTLIDSLPIELNIVSIDTSQGSCVENGDVTCDLGDILPDDTVTITIDTTASIDGVLTNTVSISSSVTDLTPENNTDQVETVVNPLADLSITQTDQPDPVTAQEILEYVVTVNNFGPSDAENVNLEDTLDPGVTYLSVTPSGTDCSLASQVLTCSLGTITDDQSLVITITTRTKQTTVGPITNSVVVTSDTYDPDSENNTSVVTTTLPPDNIPPEVLYWTAPTTYNQTYDVGGEVVRLSVVATDNVAIDYVLFKRWDYVSEPNQWRDIGVIYTDPDDEENFLRLTIQLETRHHLKDRCTFTFSTRLLIS